MPLHNKKHQHMTRAQLKALSTSRYASGSRHFQKAGNNTHQQNSKDQNSAAGTHAEANQAMPDTQIHSRDNAVSYYAKKRIENTKKKILQTIGFSCLGFLLTVGIALAAVVGYLYMINGQITGRVGKDLSLIHI